MKNNSDQKFWDFMNAVRGYHSPLMASEEWENRAKAESGGALRLEFVNGAWQYFTELEQEQVDQIMVRVARGYAYSLYEKGKEFLADSRECVYDDDDVCLRHMRHYKCYWHQVEEITADLLLQSGKRLN